MLWNWGVVEERKEKVKIEVKFLNFGFQAVSKIAGQKLHFQGTYF